MSSQQPKLISIIIPAYNEAPNLPLLYNEISANIHNHGCHFEFIFIDDGSTDLTEPVIKKLTALHGNVRYIQFSRNFGKEEAVSAGLHSAKGDAALILDADFQHPPQLIGDFIAKWMQGGEVIIGVRQYSPDEGRFKRFSSDLFYRLIKPIAHSEIVPHASDFRLLDRKVIDAFCQLTERNRMTRGLIDWLGFRREFVYFQAAPRRHGERSYTYRKLVRLAVNTFTAYTLLPLRLAGYLGVAILLIIGPFGIFIYVESFLLDDPMHLAPSNIVMLALLLLFLIGLVLACLGLVAMYIAHIHAEVINRPLYVVRDESPESEETAGALEVEGASE